MKYLRRQSRRRQTIALPYRSSRTRLLMVALISGCIGTGSLLISLANPADLRVEAEHFALTDQRITADTAASGGSYIVFESWGRVSYNATFAGEVRSIKLRAKATSCDGPSWVRIFVDKQQVGRFTVPSSTFMDYTKQLDQPLARGAHTVEIAFVNDYTTSTCSRNVSVDTVRFGYGSSRPDTPRSPSQQVLLKSDFNDIAGSGMLSVGEYNRVMGDAALNTGLGTIDTTSVVSESGRGKFLRTTLPQGTFGATDGIVTFPRLSRATTEATITYDIRFSPGFDWSLGGKLPGLGGVIPGKSPGSATGCSDSSNGWSGRAMWITPKSYRSSSAAPNEFIGYFYTPDKRADCGDNIDTNTAFQPGTWHTVTQRYKLNDVGSTNGIHQMYIDDQLVVNRTNVLYRTDPSVQISHLYWSIFRGGNDRSWAGKTTDYIDIDNLQITSPQ